MSQQPSSGGVHVNNLNAGGNAQVHVGDVHNHHEATKSELRDKIVLWLDAPSSASSHETARSRFTPGTGRWLLDSAAYKDWHLGKAPVVWITGKSGCCKTVLCSTIIDDVYKRIKDRDDSSFASFYFTFLDNKRQSYQALLLSLVSQLLECQKEAKVDIPKDLQSAYKNRYHSTEILEGALRSLLQRTAIAYIVIDALDECPESDDARRRLLEGLTTLSMVRGGLRLLFTSRKEADITEHMQRETAAEFPIGDRAVNDDVAIYVADQITRDAKLAKMDATVGGDIQRVLTEKAGGMFRWVYCQLEQIKKIGRGIPKEIYIRQALHDLPRTLDETYERILCKFDETIAKDVKRALEWLAYSRRPLSYAEFIETCITQTETVPYVNVAERQVYSDMVDLLSSLVEVSEVVEEADDLDDTFNPRIGSYSAEDNAVALARRGLSGVSERTVTLAHFSVKEYLLSESIKGAKVASFALMPARAYYNMAQTCLAYLSHLFTGVSFEATGTFPLFIYAKRYWHVYQREAELLLPKGAVNGLQINLLRVAGLRDAWLSLFKRDLAHSPGVTALHIACSLDLPTTTAIFCQLEPHQIDACHPNFGTALVSACRRGNRHLATILLEAGATVNLTGHNSTPLSAAGKGGHYDLVKDLLRAGADINLKAGGHSALEKAILSRNDNLCRLLLGHDSYVRKDSPVDERPLEIAAAWNAVKIVELLIAAGYDINGGSNGLGREPPAVAAARQGSREALRLLIDERVDLDKVCVHGTTALHAACHQGHVEVVTDLLAAGASPDTRAPTFTTSQGVVEASHDYLLREFDGEEVCLAGSTSITAYRFAFLCLAYDIMTALVSGGADITLDFPEEHSPLYHLLLTEFRNEMWRKLRYDYSGRLLDTVEALLHRFPKAASDLAPICMHEMDLVELLKRHGANHTHFHCRESDGSWGPCLGRPQVKTSPVFWARGKSRSTKRLKDDQDIGVGQSAVSQRT